MQLPHSPGLSTPARSLSEFGDEDVLAYIGVPLHAHLTEDELEHMARTHWPRATLGTFCSLLTWAAADEGDVLDRAHFPAGMDSCGSLHSRDLAHDVAARRVLPGSSCSSLASESSAELDSALEEAWDRAAFVSSSGNISVAAGSSTYEVGSDLSRMFPLD